MKVEITMQRSLNMMMAVQMMIMTTGMKMQGDDGINKVNRRNK